MSQYVESALFKTKMPQVAVLLADGYSTKDLNMILDLLIENGAKPVLVASKIGMVKSEEGDMLRADRNMSVVRARDFDAIFVPSGDGSARRLKKDCLVADFIDDAFMHHRVIGASGSGAQVVSESHLGRMPIFEHMLKANFVCSNGLAIAAQGSAYDIGMDFLYAIADRIGFYQAEYIPAATA